MRAAFIEELGALAEQNRDIWLLTADLGYSVMEPFRDRFPDRFVNVGVAEQNMTGIAAGLAMSGKVVFTYSIANFPIFRCLEQIRNDVCHHDLNVNIVAVGGGVAYGSAGYSHHAVEDLAVMQALPGMTVMAPGDPVEARLATRALARGIGPSYLRLSKGADSVVHLALPDFAIGRALWVKPGKELVLACTGAILSEVMAAVRLLEAGGRQAGVLSFPTLKPLDIEAIHEVAREAKLLAVIEEHSLEGGFGDAVSRQLALAGLRPKFLHLGLMEEIHHTVGSQNYLRQLSGLDAQGICQRVVQALDALS